MSVPMFDTMFAQPWNDLSDLRFEHGLAALRALRPRIVIVQSILYCENEPTDAPPPSMNVDRVQQLLDFAAKIRPVDGGETKVLIGLALIGNWQTEAANGSAKWAKVKDFLDRLKLRTDEALRLVNKQGWHKHASFGGVYLPQELWTPADANELGDLPSKYVAATIASALASIGFPQGRRTVALSPFLAELGDANATEKVFSGICRIGGVDWLLMPQDSVAVRLAPYHANLPDLRTKYGEKLQPLLKAFQAAAKDRATFGINVEAFRSSGCSAPASWARVAAQLELANDLKPQRLGTYELFADWATGELLDSYLSEHPVMRTKGVPPRPRR